MIQFPSQSRLWNIEGLMLPVRARLDFWMELAENISMSEEGRFYFRYIWSGKMGAEIISIMNVLKVSIEDSLI